MTQGMFWPSESPTSGDGTTSKPFYPTPRASDVERGGRGELLHVVKGAPSPRGPLDGGSTSSRAASRARTSATRARGLGSMESGPASGTNSPALFASFDPGTSSWRTSQLSLLGGWTPFSGRWCRTGMWVNGRAYRLPTLAPRISGTAYSSSDTWPTPRVGGGNRTSRNALMNVKGHSSGAAGLSLEQSIEVREGRLPRELDSAEQLPPKYRAVWPTPTANGNHNRKGLSEKSGDGLATAVKLSPTPTSRDWRSGKSSEATQARNSRPLNEVIAAQEDAGNSILPMYLNPDWVEWLMGFPIGYTRVEPGTRCSVTRCLPPLESTSGGE